MSGDDHDTFADQKSVNNEAEALFQQANDLIKKREPNFKAKHKKNIFGLVSRAAELGHPEAQARLGFYYSQGFGVKKNISMAQYWYTKSAEQNNPWGQYLLGCYFEDTNNLSAAKECYQLAAGNGLKDAQNALKELEKTEKELEKTKWQACLIVAYFIFMILALPASIGFGIYLSAVFIVPLVITALLIAGLMPVLALVLGIATGCGLVFGCAWLLVPSSSVIKAATRLLKIRCYLEQRLIPTNRFLLFTSFYLNIAALLTGLSFGIYLATLIAPAIIAALTAAGLAHGLAIFTALAACFVIISISIDLLTQVTALTLLVEDLIAWWRLAESKKGVKMAYLIGGTLGAAFGIYLSITLVQSSPLIATLLGIPGVNAAIAGFLLVAGSIALITLGARLGSTLPALGSQLVYYFVSKRKTSAQSDLAIPAVDEQDKVPAVVLALTTLIPEMLPAAFNFPCVERDMGGQQPRAGD